MNGYRVVAIQEDISDEVRRTGKSPVYGHVVVSEVATGTGPCRSCLGLFEVGTEDRLLFTYQPPSGSSALGAPGPVFIHSEECPRFEGHGFPVGLRELPLIFEGRTADGRILKSRTAQGDAVDETIAALLSDPDVDFLFMRHGEAGCHVARVNRN